MLWPLFIRRNKGKINGRLGGIREFNFSFFGSLSQSLKGLII